MLCIAVFLAAQKDYYREVDFGLLNFVLLKVSCLYNLHTYWLSINSLILFCLSGIPHILEHCTLCGSNQFPVRDPFMKMLNRSLATMNAMTGPDYTLYPFATPNKKDFYNLMQVRKITVLP